MDLPRFLRLLAKQTTDPALAAASRNNRDLALRLVAALNFAAFAETPRAPVDQARFRALIEQTLAHSRREHGGSRPSGKPPWTPGLTPRGLCPRPP